MSVSTCADCGKEVSRKLKKCPHCGNPKVNTLTNEMSQINVPWKVAVGVILGVFVLIYLTATHTPAPKTPEELKKMAEKARQHELNKQAAQKDADRFYAYSVAKDYIKSRLKAPSTAKFPGSLTHSDHITVLPNNIYEINSYVDSQNGFGAMIRTNFQCKVKLTKDRASVLSAEIN